MDRIKLNVGGVHFETTKTTLSQSEYFNNLFDTKWNDHKLEEIFIDRSGVLFEHVLALLINPEYEYPSEHISELRFYCMWDQADIIEKNVEDLQQLKEDFDELRL